MDADNQSFMISTGCSIGDILLPVPVAEAKKTRRGCTQRLMAHLATEIGYGWGVPERE